MCDKVVCVTKLCGGGGGGGGGGREEEEESGQDTETKKQEPHTKMWEKIGVQ